MLFRSAFSDAAQQGAETNAEFWLARAEVFALSDLSATDYCHGKALSLKPGAWQPAWLASRMHHFHGRYAVARKLAHIATERAPGHATPWLQLGRSLHQLHLYEQAAQSLQRAQELAPESPIVTEELAKQPHPNRVLRFFSRLRSKG